MANFTRHEIQTTYHNIAETYDFLSKLYPLIGIREKTYRKQAVTELKLRLGVSEK